MNFLDAKSELEKANEVLAASPSFSDGSIQFQFRIESYSKSVLTVIAGRNFLQKYHELEYCFRSVHWVDLPDSWEIESANEVPRILLPEMAQDQIRQKSVYKGNFLVEFPNTMDGSNGLVAAGSVSLLLGTCFHYMRENIEPGQRVAEWVVTKETG